MLPNMDVMGCQDLAVPAIVMQHVIDVESSFNRFAIGVVGARLVRQPANLGEAVATARMLDSRGYNFSLGLAQVNRHNLARYGLASYAQAFDPCRNLQAGARILARCHARSGNDWGKALSCYYSGDFVTGFRHGYVQKVFASMRASLPPRAPAGAIDVVDPVHDRQVSSPPPASPRLARRIGHASSATGPVEPRLASPGAAAMGPEPVVVTLEAPPTPATPGPEATQPIARSDPAFVF